MIEKKKNKNKKGVADILEKAYPFPYSQPRFYYLLLLAYIMETEPLAKECLKG